MQLIDRIKDRKVAIFKIGTAAISAVVMATAVGYVWLRATSDVRQKGTACDQVVIRGDQALIEAERQGLCTTLQALIDTWNSGNADAYASHFTEHATYTAFTGTIYQGRSDIAVGHRALFDSFLSGSRLASDYLEIQLLSPSTAMVLSRGDTYEGDTSPKNLKKVQTYMLVKTGNDWQVASFHNTQRSPVMERIQFLFKPDTRPAAER